MKTRPVLALVLAHAAADISQGSIPVLLPFFIAEHRLTYAAAAGIVFSVNLVSTLAQPVFGFIADRRARPWLIPVAMLATGAGVAFSGIAPSYLAGLLALMVTGLGIAMFHPEGARLMSYLAGEKRATAMSLFGIGGQLGFAIGPLVGTIAMLAFGLRGTVVLILPAAAVAALVMLKLPALSAGYPTRGSSRKALHQEGSRDEWAPFSCLASALLCRSVVFYGLNTFLPLYWINVLNQSKGRAGLALTVLLGSTIVGNFLGGRTADRLGYRAVTITGFALLMAFVPLLLVADSALLAMLLLIPIGLVLSAPFGPMVVLGQSYLPNRVGLASGITLGLAFSFGGLTTPILGWIADNHGLRTTIGVVACMPILCTALALMLPRPKSLSAGA